MATPKAIVTIATSSSFGLMATIVIGDPTALYSKSACPIWILDSGANNHMTGNLPTFISPFTSIDQSVRIVDGFSIPIRS